MIPKSYLVLSGINLGLKIGILTPIIENMHIDRCKIDHCVKYNTGKRRYIFTKNTLVYGDR